MKLCCFLILLKSVKIASISFKQLIILSLTNNYFGFVLDLSCHPLDHQQPRQSTRGQQGPFQLLYLFLPLRACSLSDCAHLDVRVFQSHEDDSCLVPYGQTVDCLDVRQVYRFRSRYGVRR